MSRTIPAPVFQTAGSVVPSAAWNAGPKAMGDFYLSPPIFRGRQSVAQSIPSNQYTPLQFNVNDVDTEGGHSTVTNNTRYVCQVAGWYWAEGYAAWSNLGAGAGCASATVWCMFSLNANGGSTPQTVYSLQTRIFHNTNDFTAVGASGMLQMAVGDALELYCIQGSAAAANTAPNIDLCPVMNLVWVHK